MQSAVGAEVLGNVACQGNRCTGREKMERPLTPLRIYSRPEQAAQVVLACVLNGFAAQFRQRVAAASAIRAGTALRLFRPTYFPV